MYISRYDDKIMIQLVGAQPMITYSKINDPHKITDAFLISRKQKGKTARFPFFQNLYPTKTLAAEKTWFRKKCV